MMYHRNDNDHASVLEDCYRFSVPLLKFYLQDDYSTTWAPCCPKEELRSSLYPR